MPDAVVVKPSESAVLAPPPPTDIHDMLRLALDKGISPEGLEKVVALYERMADRRAVEDFNAAFALFQAQAPIIKHNRIKEKNVSEGGASFGYTWADLSAIAAAVGPALTQNGLSYTFDSTVTDKALKVVCTLRHKAGYSISAAAEFPHESRAGMSPQQKVGSAMSYAKRYALTQVLGITTADPDNDGAEPASQAIDAEQFTLLEGFLADTGEGDRQLALMLKWAAVESLAEFPADKYDEALARLKKKIALRGKS